MNKILSFFTDDEVLSIEPLGEGHINSTQLVTLKKPDGKIYRLVLQKINSYVFNDVDGLMNNIISVTEFLKNNLNDCEDPLRSVMTVVPTKYGKPYVKIDDNYYRVYIYIDNTITYQQIEKAEDFYNCGYSFGDFQRRLADYPTEKLCETIKNFHNTEVRYANLLSAVEKDVCNRVCKVETELEFCKNHKYLATAITDKLKSGEIPYRVTHNDTKLNNVLFDLKTDKPLCVIDLDTIMPGAACYDFGDCIRFGASSAAEDEKNLEKVFMDISLFDAYSAGFLKVAAEYLSDAELDTLSVGSMVMTFECGCRFLEDYLRGDKYFTTHYEGQNLDRCRTQFKLVADMENKLTDMQNIVKKYAEEYRK